MKEDRRIRKSKNALKKALFELIVKKSFKKISVSELCELADVNRSTFYFNYEDMNNLLSDIHKDFFAEMMKYATADTVQTIFSHELHQKIVINMIEYINNNKKLVQILFKQGDQQLLQKDMVSYFMDRYTQHYPDKIDSYPFIYHTLAFFALLNVWIKDDFPCNATEFAQIIIEQSKTLYKDISII